MTCTPYGYNFTGWRRAREETRLIWVPPGIPPTVQIDPEQLARQAIAQMRLLPPPIGIAPKPTPVTNEGFVRLPVWMWMAQVNERTWGPISRTASIPGLSVTATAKVSRVAWSMGDGGQVACATPGTPFDPAGGVRPSPDCGYQYERTSASQHNGHYTVTARAEWTVAWRSTLGETGTISLPLSSSVSIKIGELRPVLVDPGR
ncbi:MAG TPA: hypothetical protein VEK80_12295 [Kribbellaceae bacterium]|nr:hypothetical protein [Kribbellaceae bacterium]